MPDPLLDPPPGAVPLDRQALIARVDSAPSVRPGRSAGTQKAPLALLCPRAAHRLLDHGAVAEGEDLRVRVSRSLAGSSARGLLEKLDGQEIQLPVVPQLYPDLGHLRWHHTELFKGAV